MSLSKPPVSFINMSPWGPINWSPCFSGESFCPEQATRTGSEPRRPAVLEKHQFIPHMFVVRNSETLGKVLKWSIFRNLKTNTFLQTFSGHFREMLAFL